MFCIVVAALCGYFCYAVRCIFQKVPGLENPEVNNIVHAGNVKFLPVDQLEVPGADMDLSGHVGNIPGILWGGGNSSAKGQEFLVMEGMSGAQEFVLQLIEEDPEQLGNNETGIQGARIAMLQGRIPVLCDEPGVFQYSGRAVDLRGLPGQKTEQITEIFGIGN